MRLDKSHKFMDITTSASASTEMPTLGNSALKYLISFALEQLLKEKFSASMEDFHLILRPWIKFV